MCQAAIPTDVIRHSAARGSGCATSRDIVGTGGITMRRLFALAATGVLLSLPVLGAPPSSDDDRKAVADLDTRYQAAVKANDAATMDRILADDFVLVTGRGKVFTKADLLESARKKDTVYEHQEELEQKVRVWGDTAAVTALLWIKGARGGEPIDYKLWFSDTYARTKDGWLYVLGQASLPLPKAP
jgi:ketosteroid isomerase-like protein